MKKQSGFTVIELIGAIIVLFAAGMIFWYQKEDLSAQHRDIERKTAINSIYYNLEEIVHPSLQGYPAKLDAEQLKAMGGELLKDTNGVMIGEATSEYKYEPSSCQGDVCGHYVLRASLQKENEYVKSSRN